MAWSAVGTRVEVIAFAGGPEEASNDTDSAQKIDPGSASVAAISPHAGANADAFAAFGVIKVSTQSNAQAGGFVGVGFANGMWSDIVTLSSAGFDGMEARITAGVTLAGFISPTGHGAGSVQFNFRLRNSSTSVNGAWDTNTPLNATGFPSEGLNAIPGGSLFYSGVHEVTNTITLGSPFVLEEELTTNAFKLGCQTSSTCLLSEAGAADTDFGHSSYWNGFKSIAVKDPVTGLFNPVDLSLFSITASSGVDYSRSFVPTVVPVPAAILLFLPGLGVLACLRRAGS